MSEGMRTFIGKLKRWSPLEVQKVESSLWNNVFVFYRFSCVVMEVLHFRHYKIGLIKLVVVTCVSLHYTIMWEKNQMDSYGLFRRAAKMKTCFSKKNMTAQLRFAKLYLSKP